ncbi:MAG: CDP-alcohol phosphatidyltransferase family protein [Sulfurovaceae bacterium]|nr:CDP-alcohol phosphatidyltransferase family protein [Sulfurovaceae bacterium]MDD5549580.1 CDP-alcohol phosphatidyltransferase family protein [Sulfurovaceae bacterium]
MRFFEPNYHFNVANIVTFLNITCGVFAIYLVTQHNFLVAAIVAWIAGALDIIDGKVARHYGLSTEFGIQLDSFADFLSFVIMPSFFLFFAVYSDDNMINMILGLTLIWYIISGLRRLVTFNIKSDAGVVSKHFEGVPTPLGAILLWIIWLSYINGIITSVYVVIGSILLIAYLLNSKVKIPHL